MLSARRSAMVRRDERGEKRRIDVLLVERGLAESRERAQALLLAGAVTVAGRPVTKPGAVFPASVPIAVTQALPYVSRGGYKLAHALDRFGLDVRGRVAVDVGASTGGFTDVLLQRGARRVYAVDVGYGELDWRLRQDPRVVPLERTNVRYLEALPEPAEIATVDVSFISLRLVLPAVRRLLRPDAPIIALVKPQFEAGRAQVGRGGVVRDPAVHRQVLTELAAWLDANRFRLRGLTASPITGPAGNVEFLAWIEPAPPADAEAGGVGSTESVDALVAASLAEAQAVAAGARGRAQR
jgi:23S rRNA (cytidine1920-2'-O)/16S rRNA (cytidine1409-2'-O)-methyltransferase